MSRAVETTATGDNNLQADVLDALSRASVSLPVWHLAPRERWALLRDTLLGHVMMRGGVRPRDMPLDPDCRKVIETAASVNGHAYWAGGYAQGERMRSRFGDWLYAFAVLVEPAIDTDPCATAHAAVATCATELLLALDAAHRDDPERCVFLHRLLGVLGLSRQEWKRLTDVNTRRGDVLEHGSVARVAARVCAHRSDPAWNVGERTGADLHDFIAETDNCKPEDKARLLVLDHETRSLASLKPMDVQEYIHRASSHWMMRGASTWCAQALAFARDITLKHCDALLLSDGDAFVSFVTQKQLSPASIVGQIASAWCDPDLFGSRFPRLKTYLESARAAGVSPLVAMPDISLRCTGATSLLDLCLLRSGQLDFEEAKVGWSDVRATMAAVPGVRCQHVEHEPAILHQPPAWLEKRSESHHGLSSLAWSLCGTTLRTHWHHGICVELGLREYSMMHVHHGGWLRQLDMYHDRLTFVKLDGDRIGKTFEETPVPGRPLRSLTLGQAVLERVVRATRRVVAVHDHHRKPPYLPVDLVYFGGDDIVFCMPGSYLPEFLAGFGEPLGTGGVASWAAHEFSYLSVSLPPGDEFGKADHIERSKEFGQANLAAVRTLSPGLRLLGKKRARDQVGLASLNDAIRDKGYRCEWAGSSANTGRAQGISLKLVRLADETASSA